MFPFNIFVCTFGRVQLRCGVLYGTGIRVPDNAFNGDVNFDFQLGIQGIIVLGIMMTIEGFLLCVESIRI